MCDIAPTVNRFLASSIWIACAFSSSALNASRSRESEWVTNSFASHAKSPDATLNILTFSSRDGQFMRHQPSSQFSFNKSESVVLASHKHRIELPCRRGL